MAKPPKPRRRKPLPNGARAIMGNRKERKELLEPFIDIGLCKFCPTCQRAMVPEKARVMMWPTWQRILRIVERHGEITPEVLHSALWGSDPNGGPSMKTLHNHIHQMNHALAPYGLAVRAGRGRHEPYRLWALSEALEAAE